MRLDLLLAVPTLWLPHLGAAWQRCYVEDFGAVADDLQDDTHAIHLALEQCGGKGEGGEIVLRGPGIYNSAPMNLSSNQVLHVSAGAVLQAPAVNGSNQCQDATTMCPFPVMQKFPSYQKSRSGFGCRLGPFIGAYKAQNVSITGGGIIDGSGKWFWDNGRHMRIERPRLVELQFVDDLNIGPIGLRNSAYWTLHPIYCKRVHIHDIQIWVDTAPGGGWGGGAENTDGIDPDSCEDVLIENYWYNAGDDAIAVKSGWNWAGYTFNMSSRNIVARNCSSNGRGGYTIGSEMSGGVQNVTFEDSISTGESGIRISSQPGRGGYVKDIVFRNLQFSWTKKQGKSFLFHINQAYKSDNQNTTVTSTFANFLFSNISMKAPADLPVGDFTGGALPISNVTLSNILISGPDPKLKGVAMTCFNVSGTSVSVRGGGGACKLLRGAA